MAQLPWAGSARPLHASTSILKSEALGPARPTCSVPVAAPPLFFTLRTAGASGVTYGPTTTAPSTALGSTASTAATGASAGGASRTSWLSSPVAPSMRCQDWHPLQHPAGKPWFQRDGRQTARASAGPPRRAPPTDESRLVSFTFSLWVSLHHSAPGARALPEPCWRRP